MRLTRETLNVTRGQVAALFQPSLEFELNAWVDDKEVLVIGGHCTNVGDHSIRITLIQLQRCGEAVNMKIPKDLILNPKQKYDTGHVHTHLPIPEKRRPGDFVRDVVMVVECSDLAGVGRHQFAYSPASGLRHERIDG